MTSTWANSDLSDDAFLGGKLRLLQPRVGYRAGVDPVLLAAAVPASSGQSALELGCGAGAALLCLGSRVTGLDLTGVEIQPGYAALATQNAERNAIPARIITSDLRNLPVGVRTQQFDHVIANPPYYAPHAGTGAADHGRQQALAGDTPLADWVMIAARRAAPKGWLTLIQRADRLPEILTALGPDMGSTSVVPLTGRQGRAADRVIVQSRKGGRGAFTLHAPIVMHTGASHEHDAPDYTSDIENILRNGAELSIQR